MILSGDQLTQKTQKKDKIKENLPHWAEFEILRNGTLSILSVFLHVFVKRGFNAASV